MKLEEIVDTICAPKINVGHVADLKILIEEYLQGRFDLFPEVALKPKHHYLCHYPELILQLGPLIRLWTLRLEIKHTYFKQCARKLHNCKNLCSTLATRHQLLQAYYSAGFLFPPELNIDIEFHADTYNYTIQHAVENFHFKPDNAVATYSVTYKGTTYKKSMLVVVDQNDQGLVFGRILLIVVNLGHEIYFVTEKCQSVHLLEAGVHGLVNDIEQKTYVCIQADKLLDYYPLPEYHINGLSLIPLHHAIHF